MTVLSRGARVQRGGRRPGWVLLTALLVLAIGASSALVFTDRVELLKLAVILALWAAVAGAFVSVLYRRQSDADRARVRDLKLVYDLQLDREISARREYELTVESQLRRELASELRAQNADDVAALRAELNALRTSLEILFDTDLKQRPALETLETEAPAARAYSEWDRNRDGVPVDWVPSDRVTPVPQDHSSEATGPLEVPEEPDGRADETAIIDVPEEPLLPHRQPPQPQERAQDRRPAADGLWLPPGTAASGVGEPTGRRRRARRISVDEPAGSPGEREAPRPDDESSRRSRSRHSAEYRDFGVRNFTAPNEPVPVPPPVSAPAAEPAPRHGGGDGSEGADGPPSGGQSVADLLARLQVEPSGGGRRRRRNV